MRNWSALQTREGKPAGDVSVGAMSMASWKADKSKGGVLHISKSGGARTQRKRGKFVVWVPPEGGWPTKPSMNPVDYNRLGTKGSL